jgi:hypothetical protein
MVLRTVGILPQQYTGSQPEDRVLFFHSLENLKSRIKIQGSRSLPYVTLGSLSSRKLLTRGWKSANTGMDVVARNSYQV